MVTKEQARPVWKCRVEGCNYTADSTMEGYKKLSGHQLAHTGLPKAKRGFHLVDERTGEVLATKLEEAITKGFVAPKLAEPKKPAEPTAAPAPPASEAQPQKPLETPPPPEAKPAPPEKPPKPPVVETKPAAEVAKEKAITEPAMTPDGIFAYTIHLPADAFSLFNLAKSAGLEKDVEKPFDEWLWECVTKRFETD